MKPFNEIKAIFKAESHNVFTNDSKGSKERIRNQLTEEEIQLYKNYMSTKTTLNSYLVKQNGALTYLKHNGGIKEEIEKMSEIIEYIEKQFDVLI